MLHRAHSLRLLRFRNGLFRSDSGILIYELPLIETDGNLED